MATNREEGIKITIAGAGKVGFAAAGFNLWSTGSFSQFLLLVQAAAVHSVHLEAEANHLEDVTTASY